MTQTVFCRKYQMELEALEHPPMPGALGETLQQTVSKKAWQEWLSHQTLLINEKRLNVMQPETRTYLTEQREKFFSNQVVEQAEGWVKPNE